MAASSAALLMAVACSKPAETRVDAGAEQNGRPTSPRAGVKVPMPEGWRAEIGADQSFLSGPPDRTILRVDLRPGAAGSFPTPDGLERAFAVGLPNARIERERFIEGKDFVGVRLDLSPVFADGGAPRHHDVFIGARRVGKDLFLCSTAPGASEPELEQAEKSCSELSWSEAR